MAFLAHDISWHTLSSMFQYRERCETGPQYPDLWPKSKECRRKEIEYFARKFEETVREHATAERQRFRPTQDYIKRAEQWTASEPEKMDAVEPNSLMNIRSHTETTELSLEKRNAELRSMAADPWSTSSPERRLVYPPDFATTYMSCVPSTSGGPYGRRGIVEDLMRVEAWIDFAARSSRDSVQKGTEDEHNRLWLDRKSCSDIIRLSIIDAALTDNAGRKMRTLETIILLAHHPQVGITPFISDGMSCCNKGVGLMSLVRNVAMPFVYLNLLWTYVEGNPSSSLLQPREQLRQAQTGYHQNPSFASLLPRPAYMNTRSFNIMMATVLEEHGHVVEHVIFNPLLAPYDSGRRSKFLDLPSVEQGSSKKDFRRERDVFTDLPALKESLKGMWKILVYCDILFKEIGKPINWEYVVIESLSVLFQDKGAFEKVMGKGWVDYDVDRGVEDGFGFFASIVDEKTAS